MNTALKTIDADDIGPNTAPDPFVSMVERIVMDPSVPIDRLERVLAMKERMEDRARQDEDREARRAYFDAMAKCQEELPIVIKNRVNEHTRSRYADLAAIETQAMPVIHKHGFSTSFWPAGYNDKGEQVVAWRISHSEGHSESGEAAIPVDKAGSQGKVNKTDTQAFGSTASYGRRYLVCMLFNISTGDDNDGNRIGGAINDEQVETLRALIVEAAPDLPKFLDNFGIDDLAELPVLRLSEATMILNMKIASDKKKAKAKEGAPA